MRKTGKQEPSRSPSTQKRMSIISMEYPSNCQIFGNQYYEKTKQRKQPPKLQHQTESAKVRNRVWFCTGPNSKSTNQERPQNISILCKHIIPDTQSHTLPDDEKAFDNVWHNGLRYKIYQLDLPTKLCRWLSDFLVGRVIQVKIEGFLSPKVYPKADVPQGSNLSPLLFLICVNDMPNPSHHQTDKSQFADDAGQWAVSKNIDLAAEYLQRDLDKLARWCAKWRIKLNPEKTKLIIFSKSRFAIRAEPALSLYGDLLSYYPQIKFLGITFDNRMTFTKHFEEILERCNQKFHRLRILVNKKWGPSPETILQIYKQCVRPIFEYGIVSTVTVSETVITKIQRVQNSFIRLALRLPKYVSARLLHEASGLPYVKERLISVGQNHLARMHANPLVEHTINSAKTNIAWDKYKTPISILKPPG